MQSIRSVTRAYTALLHDVANNDYYTRINLLGRVNCYSCKCGHITKTVDVDPGVTPMFYRCESCGQRATSSMYNDIAPHLPPTIEWYRPSLKATLKMRKNEQSLQHVLDGGLLTRPLGSGKSLSTIETSFLEQIKDSERFQLDVMIDFDAPEKEVQHYERVVQMLLDKNLIRKDDSQPDEMNTEILFTYYVKSE